jgi:hypothetical protein
MTAQKRRASRARLQPIDAQSIPPSALKFKGRLVRDCAGLRTRAERDLAAEDAAIVDQCREDFFRTSARLAQVHNQELRQTWRNIFAGALLGVAPADMACILCVARIVAQARKAEA